MLLEHLPTSRDITSLINLTPGVSQGSGFGGTQGSNALWVDGVNVTETTTQTPWAPLQLQLGGRRAGAGARRAGGVRAVHRRRRQLRAAGRKQSRDGTVRAAQLAVILGRHNSTDFPSRRIVSSWDSSGQLGGPLSQDRAWFFFGYHYERDETRPPIYSVPGRPSAHFPRPVQGDGESGPHGAA